jgi:hypothetical protein
MGLWFASLVVTVAPGCHPPPPPTAVSPSTGGVAPEDRILALQSREFLAYREQLARRGQWARAHDDWAERALLTPEVPAPDTREAAWSQHLQSAIAAYEHSGNRGVRAAERLAEACDRAGWFREAKLLLEPGERTGKLSPAGERLLKVVRNLDHLAQGLDSLVTPAEKPGLGLSPTGSDQIASRAAQVARRFGVNNEALRTHALLLSTRPWPSETRPDRIELAVLADVQGPFPVRQGAGTFTVRRFVLDDNAILESVAPHPWDSATLSEVEAGVLLAYHRRDYLRTEAVTLYRSLEDRGGAVPALIPGAPDSTVARDLRLASVVPLFDRARADRASRREILRRFVTAYIEARMAQGEAAGGSELLRERAGESAGDGDEEGAAQRLLAVLEFAPLPRLALADAIDRGEREPGNDAEGARRVVRALEEALQDSHAGAAALAALSEERLRELARGAGSRRAFAP